MWEAVCVDVRQRAVVAVCVRAARAPLRQQLRHAHCHANSHSHFRLHTRTIHETPHARCVRVGCVYVPMCVEGQRVGVSVRVRAGGVRGSLRGIGEGVRVSVCVGVRVYRVEGEVSVCVLIVTFQQYSMAQLGVPRTV